jgi:hypothetical protein
MARTSPLASKIAGILLPFVVVGILGYSWYIYIFRICVHLLLRKEEHKAEAVIFMIIASSLWSMALLCYIRVLSTSPGKPDNVNQSNIKSFPKRKKKCQTIEKNNMFVWIGSLSIRNKARIINCTATTLLLFTKAI